MIVVVNHLGVSLAGRYSARFFQTAGEDLMLLDVLTTICNLKHQFTHDGNLLSFDGSPFSEIESIVRGSSTFDDYMKPIWDILNENRLGWPNQKAITNRLQNCVGIIHFENFWPDNLPEQRIMFDRLDLIWDMLFDTSDGVVLVDGGWFSCSCDQSNGER